MTVRQALYFLRFLTSDLKKWIKVRSWAILLNLCASIDQKDAKDSRAASSRSLLVPLVKNFEIQTSSSSMQCILCYSIHPSVVYSVYFVCIRGLGQQQGLQGLGLSQTRPTHPQTSRRSQFKQQQTHSSCILAISISILSLFALKCMKSFLTCIVDCSRHDVCKNLGAHNTFLTSPYLWFFLS